MITVCHLTILKIDDDVLTYASQHGRVTMSHVERKQAGDQNEEEEFISKKAASFKIPVFKCYDLRRVAE